MEKRERKVRRSRVSEKNGKETERNRAEREQKRERVGGQRCVREREKESSGQEECPRRQKKTGLCTRQAKGNARVQLVDI